MGDEIEKLHFLEVKLREMNLISKGSKKHKKKYFEVYCFY
jgi:hypothetical protein